MEKRLGLYKVYSVIILVPAIIGFISSIIGLFIDNNLLLSNISAYSNVTDFIKPIMLISALINFLVGYLEFSSVFSFTKIVKHIEYNNDSAMNKISYVLPSPIYKIFGICVVIYDLIITAVMFGISIMFKDSFPFIPVATLFILFFTVFYSYIVYYARYKAFSDLYDYATATDKTSVQNNINNNDTGVLKGYGIFMIVLAFISVAVFILCAVSVILISLFFPHIFNIWLYIALAVLFVLCGYTFFMKYTLGRFFADISSVVKSLKREL